MTITAYLRVSTEEQDLANQKLAILEYCQKQRIQVDDFVEVKMSTRRSIQDRLLKDVLAQMRGGDVLIVTEISRLARSLPELLQIVNQIIKKKARVIAIKEGIDLEEGTQDIKSKMMVTLFGLFAEIERDMISQRTKEGIIKAKASGRMPGLRKGTQLASKLDGREEEIIEFLDKGVSLSSIAKIMDVHYSTLVYHMKKKHININRKES